jgi:acyl carrier protein
VSDGEAMRNLIERAERRFGRIHGVVHAAGNPVFAAIPDLTARTCNDQFSAKILGAEILRDLFANRQLDFFHVFSSLSAVLGGLGHAAYSGANAALISLAADTRFASLHPQVICWDTWVQPPQTSTRGMTFQEGLSTFERVTGQTGDPIAVSTSSLEALQTQWLNAPNIASDTRGTNRYPRPDVQGPLVPPTSELESRICEIWREVLGLDEVGTRDNFFDLGGDSVCAVKVFAQLSGSSEKNLSIKDIYIYPTISQLAEYVAAKEAIPTVDFTGAHNRVVRRRASMSGLVTKTPHSP